jgi:hypothetical protein
MPFTYTTRRGRTYYRHTGPKRGGGIQHYISTDPDGAVAEAVPNGFEIYETPNGQVYLRKSKPALIRPDELALVKSELSQRQTSQHCYLGIAVGSWAAPGGVAVADEFALGGRAMISIIRSLATRNLYEIDMASSLCSRTGLGIRIHFDSCERHPLCHS